MKKYSTKVFYGGITCLILALLAVGVVYTPARLHLGSSSTIHKDKQITVRMVIKTPGYGSAFDESAADGSDVCDLLRIAKENGKIQSLTLDDKYLLQYHTLLVSEMNGYSSYWTFKVNDTSPDGCSLSKPKSGDTIVWEYNK